MSSDAASEAGESAWPGDHLETLGRCPVCGSVRRAVFLEGLRDHVFRVAPGRWTLWRCGACEAAYLDPRPDSASIGLAYRTYYTHGAAPARDFASPGGGLGLFLKRLQQHAYYNRAFGYAFRPSVPGAGLLVGLSAVRRTRADHRIRHLPAPPGPGRRLLDLGCGDGDFLRIARALGFDAVGLDVDGAAVEAARSAGLSVLVGALEDAPLDPGTYDHVTMSHVIEHLHDPVGSLRRVFALLRPGGRLWVQTPNLEAEGLKRFGPAWRGLEPPRHLALFGPGSLDRALRASGFDRVATLPPRRHSEFYLSESEAVQRRVPVERLEPAVRRRIRSEARRLDRAAMRRPDLAECVTMIAYRPGPPDDAA